MESTLFATLQAVLKQDDRFFAEDRFLKNQVIEYAHKYDEHLIKILLSSKETKDFFFKEIGEALIFNKDLFVKFVSNKEFLPDSYTAFRNKVGLACDEESFIKEVKDVSLVFPFKDCVLEGGQTKEDQSRQEVFHNHILSPDEISVLLKPKVLTNFRKWDEKGGHEDFEITDKDNWIIKGNNLLVLHSLKERFEGRVKLIYIDPPYNTGNDSFKYNDRFNHASWLVFMKNRLEVARELLRDDGVIFVQCDDNEQAYLKVLMDEIFKDGFVKTIHVQMSIVQGEKVRAAKEGGVVKNGEYLHVFSKNGNRKVGLRPLYDPSEYDTHYSIYIDENYNEKPLVDFCLENSVIKKLLELAGLIKNDKLTNNDLARAYNEIPAFREFIHQNSVSIVRTHTMIEIDEEKLEKNLQENKTYIYNHRNREYLYGVDSKGKIKQRFRLSDKLRNCDDYYNTFQISNMRGDWWSGFHIDMGNINKESNVSLDDGQKPERLLKNIIEFTTNTSDIVLDFFSGSGTSLAVAHKMGRQYIGVEQMEYIKDLPEARLKNVINGDQTGVSKAVGWKGGGSFIYAELFEWNAEYARKIQEAKDSKNLLALWEEMKAKRLSFLSGYLEVKKFEENMKHFEEFSLDEQKAVLMECLNHNFLYIPMTEIEDAEYKVSEEDKKKNYQFYKK